MKIHHKLFLIFFVASLLLVISLVTVVQWSLDKGMVDYVNTRELITLQPMVEELAEQYQYEGSWYFLQDDHRLFKRMLRHHLAGSDFSLPPPPEHRPGFRPKRHDDFRRPEKRKPRPRREHRADQYNAERRPKRPPEIRPDNGKEPNGPPRPKVSYAVLDANKMFIVGDYPQELDYSYQEIMVNERLVGYLAVSKRTRLTQGFELDFVQQQVHYLWYLALAVLAFVLLISFPLARHFLSPIRTLAKGMHKLTQGEYQQSLPLTRKDEFGELNRDFNELAQTLATNEEARKRWLANISHELRTPIAILRGELEAILDGVRKLDKTNIESAHQEVRHLQRLVEDLHQLTSADIGGMSYRKKEIDITQLLHEQSNKFSHYLAGIEGHFDTQLPDQELTIFADKVRIAQLLENIVTNSVKYAGHGCRVKMTLAHMPSTKSVILTIEDNGPGVEDKHYQHLFEHLYRADDSRSRETGGTGLGLSICAHIVEAHQGSIEAKPSTLGGLAVIISLPLIV